MNSFEQKIKERNNLLKSQVESLTGRNELVEVVDTLLKAGVAEEDLVEKAKYIRREADGKGGYKYIYSEPKENKIKTDNIKPKFVTNNGRKFELVSGDLSNPRGTIEIKYPDGHIESRHANWTDQYEDKKTDKVDKKESGINDHPQIKSLINTLTTVNSKYSNPKNVTVEGTPKGNWRVYYKGKDTGTTIGGNTLSEETIQKFGLEHHSFKSSESDLEKAKAGKKQQKKIKKVMDEWKAGTLKTSAGEPVKDQKQAIAIAMSEAGISVKKSVLSTVLKQNDSGIEKGGVGSGRHKVKFDDYKNMFHSLKNKTHEEARKIRSDYFDEHYGKPSYNMKMFNLITDVSNSKNTHPGLTEKDKERSRKKMSKYEEKYKSEENDILKSHLGEFSYSEKLGIKKTGKEIKEKFKANLQKEQSECNELKSKLGVLKTKIGEEPTKKCDYWQIDAYEDKGIDIPLVYDYSYMTEKVAYDQVETQLLIGETPKVENTSKLKYEYNEIVRKYIDCQKEILQINTILNNYKDTDIYQLTISQATVLGF